MWMDLAVSGKLKYMNWYPNLMTCNTNYSQCQEGFVYFFHFITNTTEFSWNENEFALQSDVDFEKCWNLLFISEFLSSFLSESLTNSIKLSVFHVCFVTISSYSNTAKKEFVLKLHSDVCAQIRPINQLPHANRFRFLYFKRCSFPCSNIRSKHLIVWQNGLCDPWQSLFTKVSGDKYSPNSQRFLFVETFCYKDSWKRDLHINFKIQSYLLHLHLYND